MATWALPDTEIKRAVVWDAIGQLEGSKARLHHVAGDDQILDHINAAIARLHVLLNEGEEKEVSQYG